MERARPRIQVGVRESSLEQEREKEQEHEYLCPISGARSTNLARCTPFPPVASSVNSWKICSWESWAVRVALWREQRARARGAGARSRGEGSKEEKSVRGQEEQESRRSNSPVWFWGGRDYCGC